MIEKAGRDAESAPSLTVITMPLYVRTWAVVGGVRLHVAHSGTLVHTGNMGDRSTDHTCTP